MNRLLSLVGLVVALLVVGCSPDDINRHYGQRRSSLGSDSVNGTGVLAQMFEHAGHRVTTWRRLSPKLHQYDVLVWFPDSFNAPSGRERQFLDQWLSGGSQKVLVYVGRDYDAGPVYWRKMQVNAPAEESGEIAARLSEAETQHATHRSWGGNVPYGRWFVLRPGPREPVHGLRGPWAEGIDASKTEIVVATRLAPPESSDIPTAGSTPAKKNAPPNPFAARPARAKRAKASKYLAPEATYFESLTLPVSETLLESDEGVEIVRRVTEEKASSWSTQGKVIVVANGSFLLNLPLVNHEHRKLAGRLIAECGGPGKVAFLESDESGLETFQQEPDSDLPSGLELFTIFPINAIILHLIAVGILYCFAALPIFGRPQRLPPDTVSDFGAHLTAVGELLQFTRDRQAARQAIDTYFHTVRGNTVRGNADRPRTERAAPTSPQPPPAAPT